MNREERRKQLKEMRRDPKSKICPHCKQKTLHVAKPTHDYLCDIICLYCGKTIAKDSNTAIPWTYV